MEPGQRWAFTRIYIQDGDAETERYDPRRPPGEEWFRPVREQVGDGENDRIVIEGRGDPLRPCDMPSSDYMLMPEGNAPAFLRTLMASGARLVGGGAGERRYAFRPPAGRPYPGLFGCRPTDMEGLYRNLAGEMILNANESGFTLRLYAPAQFRFRLRRYVAYEEIRQYGEVVPGGPIILLSFEQTMGVWTPFRTVSRGRLVAYSDFERVYGEMAD